MSDPEQKQVTRSDASPSPRVVVSYQPTSEGSEMWFRYESEDTTDE